MVWYLNSGATYCLAQNPPTIDKIRVADWSKTRSRLDQNLAHCPRTIPCQQNSWSVTILLDYGQIFVLVYVMITTMSRASVTMSHTLFVTVNILHYGLVFDLVYVMITTSSRECMSMSHKLFVIVVNFSLIMCL
jgi:hypothetical protein